MTLPVALVEDSQEQQALLISYLEGIRRDGLTLMTDAFASAEEFLEAFLLWLFLRYFHYFHD